MTKVIQISIRPYILSTLLLYSYSAPAEYRAFKILLVEKSGNKTELESTLDPLQYRGYYNVPAGTNISYTATWMCRGNTSRQAICPNPKQSSISDPNPSLPSPPSSFSPPSPQSKVFPSG